MGALAGRSSPPLLRATRSSSRRRASSRSSRTLRAWRRASRTSIGPDRRRDRLVPADARDRRARRGRGGRASQRLPRGRRRAVGASGGRLLALSMGRAEDGFVGAMIAADDLADLDRIAPVLDELERRGAFVMVHPGGARPPAGAPDWWAAVVDYTAQMQRAYAAWLAARRRALARPADRLLDPRRRRAVPARADAGTRLRHRELAASDHLSRDVVVRAPRARALPRDLRRAPDRLRQRFTGHRLLPDARPRPKLRSSCADQALCQDNPTTLLT